LAEHFQMQETIVPGFLHAEHHRTGRRNAQAMRRAVNGKPFVGAGLEPRDPLTDAIDQDLRTRARQRTHAGCDEPRQRFLDRQVGNLANVQNFVGRKGVKINGRVVLLQPAEEILVVGDAQLRIESALEQDLNSAGGHGLVHFGGEFSFAERIAAWPAGGAVEGAETAVDVADVRVVDVPFDDVRHPPTGMQLAASHIGRQPQSGQRGVGRQVQCLIHGKPLAVGGFAQEVVEGWGLVGGDHGAAVS